jgi:predicted  nucleic acid-binding Zn-ribbon protein
MLLEENVAHLEFQITDLKGENKTLETTLVNQIDILMDENKSLENIESALNETIDYLLQNIKELKNKLDSQSAELLNKDNELIK